MIAGISGLPFVPQPIAGEKQEPVKPTAADDDAVKTDALAGEADSESAGVLQSSEADNESEDDAPQDDPSRYEFDRETLDKIAERVLNMNAKLSIESDEALGDFIYRLVDKSNGEIIRQYPADEILERERVMEQTKEHLVDEDA